MARILNLFGLPPESAEQAWIILYLALVILAIFLVAYWLDNRRDRRGHVPHDVIRWSRW